MSRARLKPICPPILAQTKALVGKYGGEIKQIEPFGAEVLGLDFSLKIKEELWKQLQKVISDRGFICFRNQGILSAEEQIRITELWGSKEVHSTHTVHPSSPHRHVFRLSNDPSCGITDVGPQWHNDGSFLVNVFSHVAYHIVKVPKWGGDTQFSYLPAAYDSLSLYEQKEWSRSVSVNATTGAIHPVTFRHPYSGRKICFLHLGMTGAVIQKQKDVDEVKSIQDLRCLQKQELKSFMKRYNQALTQEDVVYSHNYADGDLIIIDNLTVAHRASPEAHLPAKSQGLRVLHRTTLKGLFPLVPDDSFGLPPVLRSNPFESSEGEWVSGGLGFRWDDDIAMRN
mmetsp:Transcript_17600/g.23045  ORF Transcript_17600/g.23045 Transcript_17600/m.23045 type:complete len:341 (+) Transcript_17600:333-1355(+)